MVAALATLPALPCARLWLALAMGTSMSRFDMGVWCQLGTLRAVYDVLVMDGGSSLAASLSLSFFRAVFGARRLRLGAYGLQCLRRFCCVKASRALAYLAARTRLHRSRSWMSCIQWVSSCCIYPSWQPVRPTRAWLSCRLARSLQDGRCVGTKSCHLFISFCMICVPRDHHCTICVPSGPVSFVLTPHGLQ